MGNPLLILATTVVFQAYTSHANECQSANSCKECIIELSGCSWCSAQGYTTNGHHRCDIPANQKSCGEGFLDGPFQKTVKIKKNQEFESPQRLIKPQRVDFKLKQGESGDVQIKIKIPSSVSPKDKLKIRLKYSRRIKIIGIFYDLSIGRISYLGNNKMVSTDLHPGEEVELRAFLKVLTCDGPKRERLRISARVASNAKSVLKLNVEKICECQCSSERYSGESCQCDDYSCSYHNNQLCGGNGVCRCGVCDCFPGYLGEACGCPTSAETCIGLNGEICGGHGTCECGVCQCESLFRGRTCEECPTCPGMCGQLMFCVECWKATDMRVEQCTQYCGRVKAASNLAELENHCQFIDDDNCRFTYSYGTNENGELAIAVNSTKECP